MHQSPQFIHKCETMGNHIIELALPFLLFIPWRTGRVLSGKEFESVLPILFITLYFCQL